DDREATILVDAVPRGGPPGTLYVIEPDPVEAGGLVIEGHGMDPVRVLRMAAARGAGPRPGPVVGCEPATLGGEEEPAMGLSRPVEAAVDEAIRLIHSLIDGVLLAQPDLTAPRKSG